MSDFKKIVFRLKADADGYPPVAFESLWGMPSGANAYSIDNVPYYICGVSKGDVVAAAMTDGEIIASAVIARGGHSTLRVFADAPERRATISRTLTELGAVCSATEGLSLFAVDIPQDVDFRKIDSYLAANSDGVHAAYEDACLQHGGIDRSRIEECLSLAAVPLQMH